MSCLKGIRLQILSFNHGRILDMYPAVSMTDTDAEQN
jgi:hypothetical protein